MREPSPRSIHTAHGGAACQLDATPPASTDLPSSVIDCDFAVRPSMTFSCSAIIWSMRSSNGPVLAAVGGADSDIWCLSLRGVLALFKVCGDHLDLVWLSTWALAVPARYGSAGKANVATRLG